MVHNSLQSTAFFPADGPGMKIIQTPKHLLVVYLLVILRTSNRMQTYLNDQDGRLIDLRGEHLTIRFHLLAFTQ